MNKSLFDIQMFATPVQPNQTTGDPGYNTHGYTDAEIGTKANFGKLLEPGLRKIFFETYDEVPEQFSQVFNIHSSTKARETDWGMGAFGDWTPRASQVDEVDYKTLSPGLERTYTHQAFTQGFMVTREMYDDDQYRQFEKFPKAMARAGRAKVEKDAASLFKNAFTVNGYDGKPLISDTHPLLDSAGTASNLVAGALGDATLKKAIQTMRETKDEAGNLITVIPDTLVVPPALQDTATRLLFSTQVIGSGNNDTNKFLTDKGIKIVVLDYIGSAAGGSDTAFFLMDSKRHELNFFWRVKPEFKWDEDFDTFVSKYRGYMRYSFGYSDWRGIVGSTGA